MSSNLIVRRLFHRHPLQERAVFIVAAPRAGSALFRLIASADQVFTLDAVSRRMLAELVEPLRDAGSDRLTDADLTPELIARMRRVADSGLVDLLGRAPAGEGRLLDQSAVSALRLPLLSALYPHAQFIYLHRDARTQIGRISAAWRSGHFVTRPALAGWDGPPWSLPLSPGWQALGGRALDEIAAGQWAAVTGQLLSDLAGLPPDRWCAVLYDELQADPLRELAWLGRFAGLRWSCGRSELAARARDVRAPEPFDGALDPAVEDVAHRARELAQARRVTQARGQGWGGWAAPALPGRQPARRRARRVVAAGSIAAALASSWSSSVSAGGPAALVVTNLNDSGAGSLRQAVLDANAAPGADTIVFQDGLSGTITLTTGELTIADSVVVTGPGADTITISGNNASRVIRVESGAGVIDVTVSDVTISGGSAPTGAGVINLDEILTLDGVVISGNTATSDGGGVWTDGFDMRLTITDSEISGNISGGNGGGMYVEDTGAPLLIQDTLISDNVASGSGGGIYFYDPDTDTTIERSTISSNTAGGLGGGIYFYDTDGGTHTIRETTISGNSAVAGGGIYLYGPDHPFVIENTTISGNEATVGPGGGIFAYSLYDGDLTVRHSTVANNTAVGAGGGIYADEVEVTLSHAIVADNTAASDADVANGIGGSFVVSNSLLEAPGAASVTDSGGNVLGQDPQLAPLADNGGPTWTHRLSDASPARNAGDPAFAAPPSVDQRGAPRVAGGRIDIGAVELAPGVLGFAAPTLSVTEDAVSVLVTVTRTGGSEGAASVSFTTTDGTATAPADYSGNAGVLHWNDGDATPNTLPISVSRDALAEADETLTVTLAAPVGATLGAATTLTITITDSTLQYFMPVVTTEGLEDGNVQ